MRLKPLIFFLLLSALIPSGYAAPPDFGENNTALGQVVDQFTNLNLVDTQVNVVRNTTLNCMELNYTSGAASPVYENYTDGDWTEWGAQAADLSQTATRSTFANLDQRDEAILYRDKDHDGNFFTAFTHNFTLKLTQFDAQATVGRANVWAFSNYTDDFKGAKAQGDIVNLMIRCDDANSYTLRLMDYDFGTATNQNTDFGSQFDEGTVYYISLIKSGTDLDGYAYLNSNYTNLHCTLDCTLQSDYTFRYLYSPMSNDYLSGGDDVNGYIEYLWIGETAAASGYVSTGYFTTTNLMAGETGGVLVDMMNNTMPTGTNMTVEYSSDGSAWTDHNGNAGFTQCVDGYQSVDLRDLFYNSTGYYRRVNQSTTNPSLTPRQWQDRTVTSQGAATTGGGLFPGLAIGISLLIIAAILGLEKIGDKELG